MRLSDLRRHLILGGLVLCLGAGVAASADAPVADAVMRGDKDVLRALPRDRKAIDAPQPDGTTALHWAVRRDDLTTAEVLIKAGADVKVSEPVRDHTDRPRGHQRQRGHDPRVARRRRRSEHRDPGRGNRAHDGGSHRQGRRGQRCCSIGGANVNAKDTVHAQTALMWAVIENHTDMVELLLARGADVNARTNVTDAQGGVRARPRRRRVRERDHPAARLADGQRRHDAAAVRGARRQRRDDAAAAGSRRRSSASRPATGPRRCSSRCSTGRSGSRPSCSRGERTRMPQTTTTAPRCSPPSTCETSTTSGTPIFRPTAAILWI